MIHRFNKKIPKLKNVDKFHYSLTVRKNIDKQNNIWKIGGVFVALEIWGFRTQESKKLDFAPLN